MLQEAKWMFPDLGTGLDRNAQRAGAPFRKGVTASEARQQVGKL